MRKLTTLEVTQLQKKLEETRKKRENAYSNMKSSHKDYFEGFEGICCICGKRYLHWGNNPEPVMRNEDGRCCDECDNTTVLYARSKNLLINN